MNPQQYTHPEIERLKADPSYHTVPPYRVQVETMRLMMHGMTEALRAEGFDGAFAERILSRALYNDPNGAKIRRESEAEERKLETKARRDAATKAWSEGDT